MKKEQQNNFIKQAQKNKWKYALQWKGKLDLMRQLYLVKKQIKSLNIFGCLISLKVLVLDANLIPVIQGIQQLKVLQRLCLSQNKICEIEALNNHKNLTTLNLNKNKIKTLENIQTNIMLEYIYLIYNDMKSIKCGIVSFINLVCIDISWNQLTSIQNMILFQTPNLRKINISHNQISNLRPLRRIISNNLRELMLCTDVNILELNRRNANLQVMSELKSDKLKKYSFSTLSIRKQQFDLTAIQILKIQSNQLQNIQKYKKDLLQLNSQRSLKNQK